MASSAAIRSSSALRGPGGAPAAGVASACSNVCVHRRSSGRANGCSRPASPLQRGLDLLGAVEGVEPFRARADLRHRLRAAHEEHAQDRGFGRQQRETLVDHLAELRRALAVRRMDEAHEAGVLQVVDGSLHGGRVVRHHRPAIRALVARGDEPVERHRVAVGHRALLLEQAAEYPHLLEVQLDHADECGSWPAPHGSSLTLGSG